MGNSKLWVGFAIVVVGAIAVIVATKIPKDDMAALSDEKAIPALPTDKGSHEEPHAQGEQQKLPANMRDIDKLTALQNEIAKMSDEKIDEEIALVKQKVQQSGLIKPGEKRNIDFNANPEAKALLTRMGMLRVEKAKRERAQATAKQDS